MERLKQAAAVIKSTLFRGNKNTACCLPRRPLATSANNGDGTTDKWGGGGREAPSTLTLAPRRRATIQPPTGRKFETVLNISSLD